jgi:membrane protein
MQIVNIIISLVILAVLFAAIFKFLPDATITWRAVWIGGISTAVLFEIGKFVIGLYLGHSKPGNAFGAASALAVILVWLYYAGMIVLFGAEFTQQFAKSRGHSVRPKKGAVCVQRESPTERNDQPELEKKPERLPPYDDRLLPVPRATSVAAADGRHAEASGRTTMMVVAALIVKRIVTAFRSPR